MRLRDLHDPNAAIRPEPKLPHSEWVWCVITIAILALGAAWILTHTGAV